MRKINKLIMVIISAVIFITACNKNTGNTIGSQTTTNNTKDYYTDSSIPQSNETTEDNKHTDTLVRNLDYINLIDYNRKISPIEVKEGDTFLDMCIKKVENHEVFENSTWSTTYAVIEIEGNVSLSGKLILSDPTFFLPDETSLSTLPRFYQEKNTHQGIMILNLNEIMPWINETFSINEGTEELIIDNVTLSNYTLTMRVGIGNEETGNIVSIDGYEVAILE